MISRDWDWSDIVNPQLVERTLARQEQRARRRKRRACDDSGVEDNEYRPAAA